MYTRLAATAAALLCGLAAAPPTHACGGLVSSKSATVSASAQRVLIVVGDDGKTDIVAQIVVPKTSDDYGVLLPVPARPTLDSEPVPTDDLDKLDQNTRVSITRAGGGGGGGGGCGSADDGALAGGRNGGGGVSVLETTTIGPVVATVIKSDDAAALTTWLGDNGFAVPTEHEATLAAYSGYFIAFKRSSTATSDAPSSIAVHFTLDGVHRGYPLRLSRVGAAAEMALVVFIVDSHAVKPDAPFKALTLSALDPARAADDYRTAVRAAIAKENGKALLIEGTRQTSALRSVVGPKLAALLERNAILTRLTAVLTPAEMTDDVSFVPAPEHDNASSSITYSVAPPLGRLPMGPSSTPPAPALPLVLGALLVCAALARQLRRRRQPRGA